jgi:hypothetical protein
MKYLGVLLLACALGACSSNPSTSIMPGRPTTSIMSDRARAQHTLDLRHAAAGTFLGCPYPSGDVWQTDISSSGLAPNSAANIKATIDGHGNGRFSAGVIVSGQKNVTNEYINMANGSTPLVVVRPKRSYHTPKSPEPWVFTPPFYIEPTSNAHALVLQKDACQYYETYSTTATRVGHQLSAYSGTFVDLTQPFARPTTGGCSTSSCIPIGLLAVRPEELAAGAISHALGWDAISGSVSQYACVSPAAVTGCTDGRKYKGPRSEASKAMPSGARIRLKASFDTSHFHPEAQIVATALRHYGAYLFDTGTENLIPFVNDVNGAPAWNSDDQSDLGSISIGDFDVVNAP